jgi:hypothetical protein
VQKGHTFSPSSSKAPGLVDVARFTASSPIKFELVIRVDVAQTVWSSGASAQPLPSTGALHVVQTMLWAFHTPRRLVIPEAASSSVDTLN